MECSPVKLGESTIKTTNNNKPMKKTLLTLLVLLTAAFPILAQTITLDFSTNTNSWMPSGSNSSVANKTAPNGWPVVFSASSYYNTQHYVMVKSNASLKITPDVAVSKITIYNTSGCSPKTQVTVKTGDVTVKTQTFSTQGSSYVYTPKDIIDAGTQITISAASANAQITKIEFEQVSTGPQEWTSPIKADYTVYNGETLDFKALITGNAPDVTFSLAEETALGTLENGVFTAASEGEGIATVNYEWAGSDAWVAGSGSAILHIQKKPAFVIDELNVTNFNVDQNRYNDYSFTSKVTEIVYNGRMMKNNSAIQLNNSKDSGVEKQSIGIIVTSNKKGYKLGKVEAEWDSNTANGRQLDIYGKDDAYTGTNAAELYEDNTKGSLIGSLVKGTNTSVDINDPFQFIGIRSNSGAQYLTSIKLYWVKDEEEGPEELVTPVVNVIKVEGNDVAQQGTNIALVGVNILVEAPQDGVDYTVYFNDDDTKTIAYDNSKLYRPGKVGESEITLHPGVIYTPYVKASREADGQTETAVGEGEKFLVQPNFYSEGAEDGAVTVTLKVAASSDAKIKYISEGSTEHVYTEPFPVKNGDQITFWCEKDGLVSPKVLYTNNGQTVSVEGIEVAEGEAEYYTLQGVKVLNPERGIYIKVVNGKATKIVK